MQNYATSKGATVQAFNDEEHFEKVESKTLIDDFNHHFKEMALRQTISKKMGLKRHVGLDDVMYICRVVGFQMYKAGRLAERLSKINIKDAKTELQTPPSFHQHQPE